MADEPEIRDHYPLPAQIPVGSSFANSKQSGILTKLLSKRLPTMIAAKRKSISSSSAIKLKHGKKFKKL